MQNFPNIFLLLYLICSALSVSTFPLCPADPSLPNDSSITQPSARTQPAPIQDNSFLIEEAYNQEDGVVQHISFMQRSFTTRDWIYTQTDEWPLRTIKHQLSLTMAAAHSGPGSGWGWGDTAVNYRYQLLGNGDARVALAPRLSLVIPSGSFRFARGNGGVGLQANVPLSLQHTRQLVTHWNVGTTWIPHAHNSLGQQAQSLNFNLGQSFVWLASARVNALVETLWTSTADVSRVNTSIRRQDLYVSPGIRWAHNFASGLQIVPGIGVPLGIGPSAGQNGLILYLSFEHPWAISHSR